MRSKSILIGLALLLGVPTGGTTSSLLAQSGQPSPLQAAPTQPTQTAAAAGQKWEYRILSSYLQNGARMTLEAFERKINEAASQGFEVQSLQSTQRLSAPEYAPPTFPDLVVLLRRPRK